MNVLLILLLTATGVHVRTTITVH